MIFISMSDISVVFVPRKVDGAWKHKWSSVGNLSNIKSPIQVKEM